jgi:arylsulfatase A-like enzyme
MKQLLVCLFLVVLALGCKEQTKNIQNSKPNIVFLLVDDMGYGDMAAHGNPIIKTPNFDRLHDESVRFTDFQVSPTCAPTRCALMTGMHEFESGVSHTIEGRRLMDKNATILPQILKNAGYNTAIFGKWHLGLLDGYAPYQRGFDVALNDPTDSQRNHYDPELVRNGKIEQYKGFRTDILFKEAIKYIEKQAGTEKPFFCYLPTYSPHAPLVVPEKYAAPYVGKTENPNFFGMIANVDENLGKLMNKLEELDIADNTLLIAINDNGGTWGVDTWNANMRGAKGNAYYGSIRAYSFWRWPEMLSPGERDNLSAHHDLLPTLASIAGAEIPAGLKEKLYGYNLSPLLEKDLNDWEGKDRMVVHHTGRWPNGFSQEHKLNFCGVKFGNYHLVRQYSCDDPDCAEGSKFFMCGGHNSRGIHLGEPGLYASYEHYKHTERGKWSLFDLSEDIFESKDIAGDNPEVLEQMSAYYDEWWESLKFE